MSLTIHSIEDDAESVLNSMGLDSGVMEEICRRGLAQFLTATPHHASNAPGTLLYQELVRSTRDLLVARSWNLAEEGLSLTFNDERKIAIVISSGDSHAGDPAANPCFKYPKGPTTRAAVDGNAARVGLFDGHPAFSALLPPSPARRVPFDQFKTWCLLHCVDTGKSEMRAELSLPIRLGDGNLSDQWESRIILVPISFDDEPEVAREHHPDGPDLDVPVRKKA